MFNDVSQFVQGISATVLGLGATDEIDLTATAIDINGTVNISGLAVLSANTTIGAGASAVDYTLTFDGESNDGLITWMEDEDSFKVEDDLVMDSTKKLYFNDEGGEYISGDATDLTIASGAKINLTATSDIVVPANVGITFGTGEKIEGDSTNITITSGADIALTATSDINVPSGVGITFGDDGEKIEGDGTDLTIVSSGVLNLAAGGTTNQIKVTDGAILPITDDDVDLGSVIGLNGLSERSIDRVVAAFRDHGYFVKVEGNDHYINAAMMKSSMLIYPKFQLL